MNFNEEKMDNVKKVGTNIFHKIKELKNKMTNLENSGGKIILISKRKKMLLTKIMQK